MKPLKKEFYMNQNVEAYEALAKATPHCLAYDVWLQIRRPIYDNIAITVQLTLFNNILDSSDLSSSLFPSSLFPHSAVNPSKYSPNIANN